MKTIPGNHLAAIAVLCLLILSMGASELGAGTVVAWGFNGQGQTNVPPGLSNVVAVSAGGMHNLALKSDGKLVGWGDNYYGQATPPGAAVDVMAVSCGWYFSMVLKSNGTVVAWGDNGYGQTNVPPTLSNVVAIAAGDQFGLALKSDGRVSGWGYNAESNTTPPPWLSNVIAIAAGIAHGVALRSDGTVIAWGYNGYGQTNIPIGLSDAVAIGAGQEHSFAVRANGTIVGWGWNYFGQTSPPAGTSNVVAVASGLANHSLALKSDGTVVGWPAANKQTSPPPGLSNVVAISVGGGHSLALTGPPPAPNQPPVAQCMDIVVSAGADCGAAANVDHGSFDPDGDPITLTQSPPGPYPLGTNQVVLLVTGAKGASNSCNATVTVLDTAPPVILDAAVDWDVLWPPNHQLVEIKASAHVVDQCGSVAWKIIDVQSNEPVTGPGECKNPDWVITGAHTVRLRVERSGRGAGRVYYLELQAEDDAGNLSESTIVTVRSPKSTAGRKWSKWGPRTTDSAGGHDH